MNARTLAPAVLFLACSSRLPLSTESGRADGANDGGHDVDAGPTADGAADAAVASTPITCTDAVADAYVAPANLPELVDARLGDVVRCAPDTILDALAMAARLASVRASTPVTSGAKSYRIAYRTRRFDGSPALSSARIFLPTAARAGDAPLLVAAHGTTGVADNCAPSSYETVSDYLVLPAVAHGYAVIVPDYAGLGTPGIHAYLDNIETGRGVLDAARALAKFTGARSAERVFLYGHSQGGGAALSAQALAPTYGAGVNVAGVVAFAPGWSTKVDVSGLANTTLPTSTSLGAPAAFAALILYGYFGNRLGESHKGDGFAVPGRASLLQLVESQCITQLPFSIPVVAPTFGSLIDETFRQTTLDCAAGKPSCAEPGKSYLAVQEANVLTATKGGAPVLAIQGLNDTVVPPATFRCVADKLKAEGVDTTVCTDAQAAHLTVVERNANTMLAWIDAKVDGSAAPTCATAVLPACQ
jgi:pimeloyl-ACP methyl ester carboxylesterase